MRFLQIHCPIRSTIYVLIHSASKRKRRLEVKSTVMFVCLCVLRCQTNESRWEATTSNSSGSSSSNIGDNKNSRSGSDNSSTHKLLTLAQYKHTNVRSTGKKVKSYDLCWNDPGIWKTVFGNNVCVCICTSIANFHGTKRLCLIHTANLSRTDSNSRRENGWFQRNRNKQ